MMAGEDWRLGHNSERTICRETGSKRSPLLLPSCEGGFGVGLKWWKILGGQVFSARLLRKIASRPPEIMSCLRRCGNLVC